MTTRERFVDGVRRYGFLIVVLVVVMAVTDRRLPTSEEWVAFAIGATVGIVTIESVLWLGRRLSQ